MPTGTSLRNEIRVRFPDAGALRAAGHQIDWQRLYVDLRRRLSTLGMSERSGEVDEFGMDEVALRSARGLLDFLYDRFWRVEISGVERLPERGPCLLVANHSGLLPYDGLILAHGDDLEPWAVQALIDRGVPSVTVDHVTACRLWAGHQLTIDLPGDTWLSTSAGAPLGVLVGQPGSRRLALPSRLFRSDLR